MTDIDRPLHIALLSYRGKPTCGGQGVYVRHLSRELAGLGHRVEVIGGPPYPELGPGVVLHRLGGLDLYAEDNPFRTPSLAELRSAPDWIEFLGMKGGRFTEPLAFSVRARIFLRRRHFDVIHDNQGLGYGLLGLPRLIATVHHPVAIDRDHELDGADGPRRRELLSWYGFLRMQHRVARTVPAVLTPAQAGRDAITAHMGILPERIRVVPLGVDTTTFHPNPTVPRVKGRIVTTASADVPLKGLAHLLRAFAALERAPARELHIVGSPQPGGANQKLVADLGINAAVHFHKGLNDHQLAHLLRTAQVACVPSLFEGFALPALEAMACGTTLVCTTAGAIPEVTGPDGHCALHVPPADPDRLATALGIALADETLRNRLGANGAVRARRFTWRATAEATAAAYRALLANHDRGRRQA